MRSLMDRTSLHRMGRFDADLALLPCTDRQSVGTSFEALMLAVFSLIAI